MWPVAAVPDNAVLDSYPCAQVMGPPPIWLTLIP